MTSKYFLIVLLNLGLGLYLTACNTTSVKEPIISQANPHYPMTKQATTATGGTGILYGIIVADTTDKDIGSGVQKDVEKMTGLMAEIATHTELRHQEEDKWIIEGDQFSNSQVSDTLENIWTELNRRATAQDRIIFYYSGHGGRGEDIQAEDETLPDLCIKGGNQCGKENRLGFRTVINRLKEIQPRFFVAIADACNYPIRASIAKDKDVPPVLGGEKSENYHKLFLEPQGSIVFASSTAGQKSATYILEGSLFTSKFIKVLRDSFGVYNPSWEGIEKEATQVLEYSNKEKELKKQTPIADLSDLDVSSRNGDKNDDIQLKIDNHFRPGEEMQMEVTSSRQDGYLFIFNAEVKDGSTLKQLVPKLSPRKPFLLKTKEVFSLLEYDRGYSVSTDPGTHFLIALLVQEQDLETIKDWPGQSINTKDEQEVRNWFTAKLPEIPFAVVKYQVE